MFGRNIKVSLEKESKVAPSQDAQNVDQAVAYSAVIASTVESVGRTILTGILVIIAADTARQVIVKTTKER